MKESKSFIRYPFFSKSCHAWRKTAQSLSNSAAGTCSPGLKTPTYIAPLPVA
jgi:hypothetical protein